MSSLRLKPLVVLSSFAAPGFFKAIDKDGSGSLDPAEVQRGFRRLGVDVRLGDPVWGTGRMLNHVVEPC